MSIRRIKEEPSMGEEIPMQVDEEVDEAAEVGVGVDVENDDLDEEDDEIVRVMDVYLSPQVAHNLYLLQYPLQQQQLTATTTAANSQIIGARIKPKHNMIEIDHGIPTSHIETEGNTHLPHRTFASHTVPVTTHLALGKIVKNTNSISETQHELHISPFSHITQMRPTFTHIDLNDLDNIRAMEEQHAAAAAAQAKLDRKPLMFQKKESERAALARKNSYSYKKASEDGEHWIELSEAALEDDHDDVFGMDDDDDKKNQQQLQKQLLECPPEAKSNVVLVDTTTADNNDNERQQEEDVLVAAPAPATTNTDDDANRNSNVSYVRSLDYLPAAPTTINISGDHDPNNNNSNHDDDFWLGYSHPNIVDWIQYGLDETAFDLPTLGGHLTALLRGGWPIPFSILKQTLPPLVPEKDILTALSSCAVMVRGNFVLQSRLLKLPKSVAKARTFIMLLLQSTGIVHRNRLDYVFGIQSSQSSGRRGPSQQQHNGGDDDDDNNNFNFANEDMTTEIIQMLLEQLGKKTASGGWVLRGQDDVTFIAKHPQTTNLHMQYWGRQMIRFQDYLQCYANAK